MVVYCSIGYRSARLVEKLREGGFSEAKNLEGSIFQWANEGRPVVQNGEVVEEVHPYNKTWGLLLE
jgi:rhodanese-related sulfurtransferase